MEKPQNTLKHAASTRTNTSPARRRIERACPLPYPEFMQECMGGERETAPGKRYPWCRIKEELIQILINKCVLARKDAFYGYR